MSGIINVTGARSGIIGTTSGVVATDNSGHVIQTLFYETVGQYTNATSSLGSFSTPVKLSMTPKENDSKFLIIVSLNVSTGYGAHMEFRVHDNTADAVVGTQGTDGYFGQWSAESGTSLHHSIGTTVLYARPSGTASVEIEVLAATHGGGTMYLNRSYAGGQGEFASTLTIMEIAA